MMPRLVAALLGLVGAGLAIALHLPTHRRYYAAQIFLNEQPRLPAVIGAVAVLMGLHRLRSLTGAVLGAVGLCFSLPLLHQARVTARVLAAEMRRGLGENYREQIPPPLSQRLSRRPWSSWRGLAGERVSSVRVLKDVAFAPAEADGWLCLDAYLPDLPPAVGDRYPAVIAIHGGSWRKGSKGGYFVPHHRHLAGLGWAVFDIEYRLSDVAKFPAQVEDISRAVTWVRAHADTYQIDPTRIILYGRSAGAHLALMAAYDPALAVDAAAVVAIYPPTDLRLWGVKPVPALVQFLGADYETVPHLYADASPVTHVRDGLPPTLLVHGGMDHTVPPVHTELLARLLPATTTPFAALRLPWSRHGFDAVVTGLGQHRVQRYIDEFLAWSVYHARRPDRNQSANSAST
jgi:acetyl esterase/lipase